MVDICRATRESPSLTLGVSPRGATALLATSRAWAWLTGRDYVIPDDVKALALPTLRHRVQLRPEAEMEGVTADSVINAILAHVPVPADGPHRTRRPPRSPGLPPRRHLGTQLDGHPRRQRPLALACACDFALAAPVRHLSLTRSGDTSVRLGETADVTLTVTNPSAARSAPASATPGPLAAGSPAPNSPPPATA